MYVVKPLRSSTGCECAPVPLAVVSPIDQGRERTFGVSVLLPFSYLFIEVFFVVVERGLSKEVHDGVMKHANAHTLIVTFTFSFVVDRFQHMEFALVGLDEEPLRFRRHGSKDRQNSRERRDRHVVKQHEE